jgi:signal transduction histidine kinase
MATDFDPRDLAVLYRLGKLVGESLDLDATLDAIVDAAHELIRADSTAILLSDANESLTIRVGRGVIASCIGERVSATGSIAGRALHTRRPIRIDDMQSQVERARPDLDEQSGTRSYLASPLIWGHEHLGVITVGRTRPASITDRHLELVSELAEHAATAVVHARAYARECALRQDGEILVRQLSERTHELIRLQFQAVQNEKLAAMGHLVQGLAHEINTPLSIVITNLSVLGRIAESLAMIARAARQALPDLRADPLSAALAAPLSTAVEDADLNCALPDLSDLLHESAAASGRVAELVRSIGKFAGRDSSGPTRLDLHRILDDALSLASGWLKHRANIVRAYGNLPTLYGMTGELTELFVHLLINAAQALEGKEEPGSVTISTTCESDTVLVRIADTGCGIRREDLARVCDPFFTTRPPGCGTGMGLAVCYGIVTRHAGSLTLESDAGVGTMVTVSLPSRRVEVAA